MGPDLVIETKGGTLPVRLDATLLRDGWRAGQAVIWTSGPSSEELFVTPSDGFACGILFDSSEGDRLTSMSGNQPYYGSSVLCVGGWLVRTQTYEKYTYASRQSGPLVEIEYTPSSPLYFSLRGFWTLEDEWTLSGDPRAPNSNVYGYVVAPPSTWNLGYLSVQVSL